MRKWKLKKSGEVGSERKVGRGEDGIERKVEKMEVKNGRQWIRTM